VSSFISNEVFSSLPISGALFILVSMVSANRYGCGLSVALGSAIALACLSKYSGFLMVMTACLVYGVMLWKKSADRRQPVRSFFIVALLTLALAGPFYFRNCTLYGKPFPQNTEFVKCFTLEYRELAFLADPLKIGSGVAAVLSPGPDPDGKYTMRLPTR
jgi:hypothetical protein